MPADPEIAAAVVAQCRAAAEANCACGARRGKEVCHGVPEYPGETGGCMSHLLLEDCIRLKSEYPERFHFLLSNHELAELGDFPICKSRRMLNVVFRCGINELYGSAG